MPVCDIACRVLNIVRVKSGAGDVQRSTRVHQNGARLRRTNAALSRPALALALSAAYHALRPALCRWCTDTYAPAWPSTAPAVRHYKREHCTMT